MNAPHVDVVLSKLQRVKRKAGVQGWTASCPVAGHAHGDAHPSLTVDLTAEGSILLNCHSAGHDAAAIVAAVGLRLRDLFPPESTDRSRIVATYDYVDERGELLYQTVRMDPKDFRQRRPDGAGGWVWNLNGVSRVLYLLPQIMEADPTQMVFVPEGEKDVETILALGGVATTNAMGAGKWRPEYNDALRGRHVALIEDNDAAGRQHCLTVAQALHGVAASVRIVRLPGLLEKGDVSDWHAAGGNLEQLLAAATATQEFRLHPGGAENASAAGCEPYVRPADGAGAAFDGLVVASPGAPMPNAATFIEANYHNPALPTLIAQGNTFFAFNGTCWPEVEGASLRSELYEFFRDAVYLAPERGELVEKPFNPTRHKIEDLLDALAAVAHLPITITPPSWLKPKGDEAGPGQLYPASEIVACANGLLHFPTRALLPRTPTFYVHHAVPFSYSASAPAPTRWLAFLKEIWGEDDDAITTLQELFGYIVSGDTSLQKIFLIVGPKRSGKGTIAKVLTAIVGHQHVAGPTTASIGTNFGLSPLIGKLVAIISDARLHVNDSVITERLLSISGEDTITVDRKYREPWTGKLPARFVILTNELPRLTDSSGALASRFITLVMTRSFLGRENPKLSSELIEELAGIFNWALDGLERLRRRGYFSQPRSSADAMRELEDLGSPVGAFLRDECVVGPGLSVAVAEVYQAWRTWCEEHGRDRPGTVQTFGRDLRAALPGIRHAQPRDGDGRYRAYEGLTLTDATSRQRAFQRVPDGKERTGTRSESMYVQHETTQSEVELNYCPMPGCVQIVAPGGACPVHAGGDL